MIAVARSPAASASRPRLSSLSSVLGSRYTSPGSRCTSEPKRVTQNAPATVRTRTTATSGSATRRARRATLSSRVSDRVKLAPPVVDAKLRPAPSPRPPPRATAAHLDQRLTAPRYRLPSMVTVCTVLPPTERPRVDAAGDGCFTTLHANSLRDALHAARRKRVDALVLSVHRCGDELPGVARFVREFPAIPAVALVSRHDHDVTETLLRLGATGVRTAVDCTQAAGWRRLRDLLAHPASPVAARILARVVPALDDAPEEVRVFFEALARLAPVLSTVRGLARHLRICPSTLMSRFYRVGLPSPKTYLAGMRLLHAAYLFLNPGLSVSDVAYRLDYSSPQSFGRHLRAMLGVTAGEFRSRFPFDVSLERYVDLLITPYRETLRAFHPLNAGIWDQGPEAARVSRAG